MSEDRGGEEGEGIAGNNKKGIHRDRPMRRIRHEPKMRMRGYDKCQYGEGP